MRMLQLFISSQIWVFRWKCPLTRRQMSPSTSNHQLSQQQTARELQCNARELKNIYYTSFARWCSFPFYPRCCCQPPPRFAVWTHLNDSRWLWMQLHNPTWTNVVRLENICARADEESCAEVVEKLLVEKRKLRLNDLMGSCSRVFESNVFYIFLLCSKTAWEIDMLRKNVKMQEDEVELLK